MYESSIGDEYLSTLVDRCENGDTIYSWEDIQTLKAFYYARLKWRLLLCWVEDNTGYAQPDLELVRELSMARKRASTLYICAEPNILTFCPSSGNSESSLVLVYDWA